MSEIDINKILDILPHRYPMLLIDRVLEYTPGESMVALKNVTINEPFFQGHFPQTPVMPGVLILESMAQVTGLLGYYSDIFTPDESKIFYLVGIDKARFKRPVQPGDQLRVEVSLQRGKRGVFRFDAQATVDGAVAARAEVMTSKADAGR